MIIYPFPPDELDDTALEQQIEAIAQTLCNVHHLIYALPLSALATGKRNDHIPLAAYDFGNAYAKWGTECLANYKELVDMGLACVNEYSYRYSDGFFTDDDFIFKGKVKEHQLTRVIIWARDHVPPLEKHGTKTVFINDSPRFLAMPQDEPTPFPLMMTDEYIVYKGISKFPGTYTDEVNIIESYRNYYRAELHRLLQKWVIKCNNCLEIKTEDCRCPDCKYIYPTWTRLEKPGWL